MHPACEQCSKYSDLCSKFEVTTKIIKTQKVTINSLQSQLESKSIRDELSNKTTKDDSLLNECKNLKSEIENLNYCSSNQMKLLHEKNEEIKNLNYKINELESLLATNVKQTDEMKSNFKIQDEYMHTLKADLQNYNNLQMEIKFLKISNEEFQSKLTEKMKDCKGCKEHQASYKELKSVNEEYRLEVASLLAIKKDLEQKLQQSTNDNERLTIENQRLFLEMDKSISISGSNLDRSQDSKTDPDALQLLISDARRRRDVASETCSICRKTLNFVMRCLADIPANNGKLDDTISSVLIPNEESQNQSEYFVRLRNRLLEYVHSSSLLIDNVHLIDPTKEPTETCDEEQSDKTINNERDSVFSRERSPSFESIDSNQITDPGIKCKVTENVTPKAKRKASVIASGKMIQSAKKIEKKSTSSAKTSNSSQGGKSINNKSMTKVKKVAKVTKADSDSDESIKSLSIDLNCTGGSNASVKMEISTSNKENTCPNQSINKKPDSDLQSIDKKRKHENDSFAEESVAKKRKINTVDKIESINSQVDSPIVQEDLPVSSKEIEDISGPMCIDNDLEIVSCQLPAMKPRPIINKVISTRSPHVRKKTPAKLKTPNILYTTIYGFPVNNMSPVIHNSVTNKIYESIDLTTTDLLTDSPLDLSVKVAENTIDLNTSSGSIDVVTKEIVTNIQNQYATISDIHQISPKNQSIKPVITGSPVVISSSPNETVTKKIVTNIQNQYATITDVHQISPKNQSIKPVVTGSPVVISSSPNETVTKKIVTNIQNQCDTVTSAKIVSINPTVTVSPVVNCSSSNDTVKSIENQCDTIASVHLIPSIDNVVTKSPVVTSPSSIYTVAKEIVTNTQNQCDAVTSVHQTPSAKSISINPIVTASRVVNCSSSNGTVTDIENQYKIMDIVHQISPSKNPSINSIVTRSPVVNKSAKSMVTENEPQNKINSIQTNIVEETRTEINNNEVKKLKENGNTLSPNQQKATRVNRNDMKKSVEGRKETKEKSVEKQVKNNEDMRSAEIEERVRLAKELKEPMKGESHSMESKRIGVIKELGGKLKIDNKLKPVNNLLKKNKSSVMDKVKRTVQRNEKLFNRPMSGGQLQIQLTPLTGENLIMERMTKKELDNQKIIQMKNDSISGTKRMLGVEKVKDNDQRPAVEKPKAVNKQKSVESDQSTRVGGGGKLINVALGQLLVKKRVSEKEIERFRQIVTLTCTNEMLPEIQSDPSLEEMEATVLTPVKKEAKKSNNKNKKNNKKQGTKDSAQEKELKIENKEIPKENKTIIENQYMSEIQRMSSEESSLPKTIQKAKSPEKQNKKSVHTESPIKHQINNNISNTVPVENPKEKNPQQEIANNVEPDQKIPATDNQMEIDNSMENIIDTKATDKYSEIIYRILEQIPVEKSEKELAGYVQANLVIKTEIDAQKFIESIFTWLTNRNGHALGNKSKAVNTLYHLSVSIVRQQQKSFGFYYDRSIGFLNTNDGFWCQALIISNMSFFLSVKQYDLLIGFFVDLMKMANMKLLPLVTSVTPKSVFHEEVMKKHSVIVEILRRVILLEYSDHLMKNRVSPTREHRIIDNLSKQSRDFWLKDEVLENDLWKPRRDLNGIIDLAKRAIMECQNQLLKSKIDSLDKILEKKYLS